MAATNRGLYIAAVGMKVSLARQDVRANNLANASTAGFAKDRELVGTFMPKVAEPRKVLRGPAVGLPVPSLASTSIDLSRGPILDTGNPLDVTLPGAGYLEVGQGADRRYVRTATLTVSAGVLSTTDGKPVMGSRGAIKVPGGLVTIGRQGEVNVGGRVVDKLRIVDAGTGGSWVKAGDGGLVATGAVPVVIPRPELETGVLEQSNVNSITEMVDMISLYRHFEAGQKAVRAIDETLEKAVTEVGSIR